MAAAGIGAAATATGVLVKSAVDGYAEYEQLVGGVDTLFKDSSAKVQEYAANAYKTAGLSANEYMSSVTGFSASLLQSLDGDTAKAADKANQAIIDMSDVANKMGIDMGMIQNAYTGFAKGNYTMLDNLKLGYYGTKEEMQRLLEDATAISGVEYDLSSYADVVDAIHVIQTEMGITGTTAKEASTTIEGSTKAMKAAWQNLLVGIADDNADMSTLMDNFADSVGTVIENIAPKVQESLISLSGLIEYLAPLLIEEIGGVVVSVLPSLLESGGNMVNVLVDGIRANAPSLIESFFQILGSLSSSVTELVPQFIQIGFQIISNLLSGILENIPSVIDSVTTLLSDIVENVSDWLPEILEMGLQIILQLALGIAQALPELIPQAVSMIITLVESLIDNIPMLIDAALQLVIGLATGIIDALPIIIEKLPEIITSIIDALLNAIPQIIDAGIQLFVAVVSNTPAIIMGIIEAIPQIIGGIIKSLLSFQKDMAQAGFDLLIKIIKNLPQLVEDIKEKIKNLPEAIIKTIVWGLKNIPEIGKNIVKGLWNGISSSWDWLIDNVKNVASSLIDSVKEIFGIHSPSTKFKWLGEMCVAGFDEGAEDLLNPDGFTKNINASLRTVSANTSMSSRLGTDSIADAVADALMSVFEATSSQAPVGEQVTQVYLYPGAAEFGTVVYGAQSDASRRGLIPRIV